MLCIFFFNNFPCSEIFVSPAKRQYSIPEDGKRQGSKVKQLLRGLKVWNDDELFTAIGQALDKVTASDAKNWFVR